MKAPCWNEIRNIPFVVVPSGNNRTRGKLLPAAFLFISFTADFLDAGENLSTYITCIALMIVPTNGIASWESDETMVGNNS